MKKVVLALILLSMGFLIVSSCKTKKEVTAVKGKPVLANVPIIIYKTKQDFSMHVPVTMSADKKEIMSYPAPSDVYYGSDLAYPISLVDGFFLDRRGIDVNSAFTKWTYYEYSRLAKTPTTEQIMNMMLELDPFTEMYHCGYRNNFQDVENEINAAIKEGKLSKYKKLR